MKLSYLIKQLKNLPEHVQEDAEVSYKIYLVSAEISLVVSLGSTVYQINNIPPYEGLPK